MQPRPSARGRPTGARGKGPRPRAARRGVAQQGGAPLSVGIYVCACVCTRINGFHRRQCHGRFPQHDQSTRVTPGPRAPLPSAPRPSAGARRSHGLAGALAGTLWHLDPFSSPPTKSPLKPLRQAAAAAPPMRPRSHPAVCLQVSCVWLDLHAGACLCLPPPPWRPTGRIQPTTQGCLLLSLLLALPRRAAPRRAHAGPCQATTGPGALGTSAGGRVPPGATSRHCLRGPTSPHALFIPASGAPLPIALETPQGWRRPAGSVLPPAAARQPTARATKAPRAVNRAASSDA
jgi:hypothetical protein